MKVSLTPLLALSLLLQTVIAAEPATKAAPVASPDAQPPAGLPDTVATVNGQPIARGELEQAMQEFLGQRGRSIADIPPAQKNGAYRMILDDLIANKLVTKASAGVKVTDEEVGAALKRVTANFGSEEEVKAQMAKRGQTIEQVRAEIHEGLQQQRWMEEQVKGGEAVADAEAEQFYKNNPQHFQMPERVRASHILVSVKADAKPETVVEKEKAAEAIAARVKKGEDFSKVATELSEDPSAKKNGGDLDFFAREQMVPQFADVAFKLKENEISDPIRSEFGFHIIKMTGRKPAETVSLEKAKPQIVAFLKQQRQQTQVEKVIRELREKADVKINLPEPTPTALGPAGVPKPTEAP